MYQVCSVIFFSLLLLSACAKCANCTYSAWQGVSLKAVEYDWGKPDRMAYGKDGRTWYGFTTHIPPGYGPSVYNYSTLIAPQHVEMGDPPFYRDRDLRCTTWFKVDQYNIVIGQTTSGSYCDGDADFVKPIGAFLVH